MAINSSLKFKLIQALMVVLITWNNEEDPIKNEGTRMIIILSINLKMVKRS